MNMDTKTSIFRELQRIYGNSPKPISEKEILTVLNKINIILLNGGVSIKEIIPKGFFKEEGWKDGLVHEVFSDEYYEKFAKVLVQMRQKLGVDTLVALEVGAGNGIFTKQLGTKLPEDISIIATDISPKDTSVKKYSYKEAIKNFQPHIVIACWPLIIANTEGESLFIRTLIKNQSIEGCFLIGVPSRCEFDEYWFTEYQEESGSSFTNIMDIPELSELQIGVSRQEDIPIKNGVNPIVLGDQGIDNSFTIYRGSTYATSRTSFISRGDPKW